MTPAEIVLSVACAGLVGMLYFLEHRHDAEMGRGGSLLRDSYEDRLKDQREAQASNEASRHWYWQMTQDAAVLLRAAHEEVIGTLVEELTANRAVHVDTLRMLERALNPPFEPAAAQLDPEVLKAALKLQADRAAASLNLPPEVTGDWSGEEQAVDPFPLDNVFDNFQPTMVAQTEDRGEDGPVQYEGGQWPDPEATEAEDIMQLQRLGEDFDGPLEPAPEATSPNPSRAATFPVGEYPEVP